MPTAYYRDTSGNFQTLTAAMVGAASSSHTHDSLAYTDTRNVNWTPKQYSDGGYDKKTRLEFKDRGAVSSPTGSTGYVSMMTCLPWGDSSGGNAYQIVLAGNGNTPYPSIRTAALDATSWGGWYDFVTEANPEIVVSSSQPTNSNAKLWVKI